MNRRDFLNGTTLATGAALFGVRPSSAAAEQPPETTRLRLVKIPSICQAPQFVAEEFFRAEGFRDIEYIPKPGAKGIETALAIIEATGLPAWATGNAHLLETFVPPPGVSQVLVFSDKDRPSRQHPSGHGQEAARGLVTRRTYAGQPTSDW